MHQWTSGSENFQESIEDTTLQEIQKLNRTNSFCSWKILPFVFITSRFTSLLMNALQWRVFAIIKIRTFPSLTILNYHENTIQYSPSLPSTSEHHNLTFVFSGSRGRHERRPVGQLRVQELTRLAVPRALRRPLQPGRIHCQTRRRATHAAYLRRWRVGDRLAQMRHLVDRRHRSLSQSLPQDRGGPVQLQQQVSGDQVFY